MTIVSALRSISQRPGVTSPRMRTAKPGPGNGWRMTISLGRPNSAPSSRTSSLNRQRSGSISSNFIFSGKPPTLWWLFISAAGLPPIGTDSITSGYRVPCARNLALPTLRVAFWKTSMNVLPMILRFVSGSVIPRSFRMNKFVESS